MLENFKNVKDDKIRVISNDIERLQVRPSMFIGYLGDAGVLHLCKEIIDNNRDECFKKVSPGNIITIDINDKEITSRDNGRGIATDMVRIVHETMNAGSNMTRDNGTTAGENGVGTLTYTALASYLKVVSLRPQEKKKLTLVYNQGILVSEELEYYTGTDHGMITTFRPSKKFLGTDKIPVDKLVEWLEDFRYTLPTGIRMTYTVKGERHNISHNPISNYFDKFIKDDDRLCNDLVVDCSGELDEIVREKTYHRKFHVEAAILYSSDSYKGEDIRKSWMNMIYTANNGMHVNGVINGLSKYLIEKAIKKKKALEGEDIKKDVLSHMHVVVKAECDFANIFNSQEKSYVFPKQLLNAITSATYDALCNMSQNIINELVDIVIQNNRVRREGEKVRNISSTAKALKSWTKPSTFIPCSSVKTIQPKELYLVEGISAGGGVREARDPKFQAILQFRGKSLNVWDEDLDRVLKSEPLLNLVKVLGCGIGPTFDINKLNFSRIILATDADIDGFHIRVGWCTFFKKYMPEIINNGMLFIAEPPLYQLAKNKDISYVATQTEYIHKCIDTVGDLQISFDKKGTENISIRDFIIDTFDYLDNLRECSNELGTNRYLLEYIANGFATYGKTAESFINNIDKWLRSLVKIYDEIGFDHEMKQLHAVINLTDQLVVIDDDLAERLEYIIKVIDKYGLIINHSSAKQNICQSTSLSRFFEYIEGFYPKIIDRFKGLGSSDASVSKEVIMDPGTRRLIRVTAANVNTMEIMGNLIGEGRDNKRARKEMLMNFKFTKADIDN